MSKYNPTIDENANMDILLEKQYNTLDIIRTKQMFIYEIERYLESSDISGLREFLKFKLDRYNNLLSKSEYGPTAQMI